MIWNKRNQQYLQHDSISHGTSRNSEHFWCKNREKTCEKLCNLTGIAWLGVTMVKDDHNLGDHNYTEYFHLHPKAKTTPENISEK